MPNSFTAIHGLSLTSILSAFIITNCAELSDESPVIQAPHDPELSVISLHLLIWYFGVKIGVQERPTR
jgi:hypothetical protein